MHPFLGTLSCTPTTYSDLGSLMETPRMMRPGTNQYLSECFLDRSHSHSVIWYQHDFRGLFSFLPLGPNGRTLKFQSKHKCRRLFEFTDLLSIFSWGRGQWPAMTWGKTVKDEKWGSWGIPAVLSKKLAQTNPRTQPPERHTASWGS